MLITEPPLPETLDVSRVPMRVVRQRDVTPPRELRVMALRFEAEAMEMGADDTDMDHVREVLRSAAESTMGAHGHQELGAAEAREEMELHITMLREWVEARIERRKRSGRFT